VSLLLYNLLLPLAVLAMLPGALRKMRARGGRSQDLWQRLGLLNPAQRQALAQLSHFDHRLWVHAVSVGEMNVALKLLAPLLKDSPNTAVFLTTTTPTGHQIATHFAAQHPHRVAVFYNPIDFPPIVSHLLDQVAPHRLILVEAEVWPNLVAAAQRRHIPITLAAARLSPRSEKRFAQFSWFTRPLFAKLSQVLVPEPEDIPRWTRLGVDPSRILHTGSVKYDPSSTSASPTQLAHFTKLLHAAGLSPTQHPILLAASTHAGEELALAQLHQHLRLSPTPWAAHLALLIVPRHIERTPDILAELAHHGITAHRRSLLTPDQSSPHPSAHPLIIDTTGELAAWQHLSHLVIIGKSFLAYGGQNPSEAAMAAKPVLFGPHMENFIPLVDLLLQSGGAIQCQTFSALGKELSNLLNEPTKAQAIGLAGQAALSKHSGAVQRTLAYIR
jgi:3-deoxy-D-manno-octulosonic-acid transferase